MKPKERFLLGSEPTMGPVVLYVPPQITEVIPFVLSEESPIPQALERSPRVVRIGAANLAPELDEQVFEERPQLPVRCLVIPLCEVVHGLPVM